MVSVFALNSCKLIPTQYKVTRNVTVNLREKKRRKLNSWPKEAHCEQLLYWDQP